jgi:FkbH-like protein
MYRQQVNREKSKRQFSTVEDYLKALALQITVFGHDHKLVPRLAQMSQKINQFNLTTRRYTEGEIETIIKHKSKRIMAFSVSDTFGDSGITGMAVIDWENGTSKAYIESFMMSCRIIGRNIEFAFMDYLICMLKEMNVTILTASYIQTSKNEVTKEFYDQCRFEQTENAGKAKKYILHIGQYQPRKFDYIEVIDGTTHKENYVHCL